MLSLLDKLSKVQEKPEPYRRMVAIVAMVILSPFVLMIWFSTLDPETSLSQKADIDKDNNSYYYEANAENNDNYNPFYVLSEVVGQASGDIKAAAGTAVKEFKSISQEYNKNEEENE